jgi:bacterioferritin
VNDIEVYKQAERFATEFQRPFTLHISCLALRIQHSDKIQPVCTNGVVRGSVLSAETCPALGSSFATMPAMRGNEKVLKHLSESLKAELTAINQYFLHSKMCENWGYFRLGAYYRKESIEEMVHAEKLMDRILFLEGTPNMTDVGPINVGRNVKAQFESDLALELRASKQLNEAIEDAVKVGDNASRALFEDILKDEEHHVDYLEGQLHAIEEIGLDNFLTQQLHKGEEEKD